MTRFLKFACVLLAVLWLPLTQHCRMEAAGVIATACESAHSHACANCGCGAVEDGGYKLDTASVKLPPPSILACLCYLCPPLEISLDISYREPAPESVDRPLDWVPSWQFVRRAAPPSRAPSIRVA